MPHPDADDLTLLALGEWLDPDVTAHVADCPTCTREVEAWQHTADLARQGELEAWIPPAPPQIWQSIVDELQLGSEGHSGSAATTGAPGSNGSMNGVHHAATPAHLDTPGAPSIQDARSETPAAEQTSPLPALREPVAPAPVALPAPGGVEGPGGGRSRLLFGLAAGLAGLVLGGAIVYAVQDREQVPNRVVQAVASLAAVDGGEPAVPAGDAGLAELLDVGGEREVVVQTPALPPLSGGSYEVWLLGEQGRMVSLGFLRGGSGTFVVPSTVDLAEYKTVDISNEPVDGNPVHSTNSIVRGSFA